MSEPKNMFLSATDQEKMAMLAAYSVHLTILVRETYGRLDDEAKKYNETLHRITSQLLAMIGNSGNRYPDDVFIDFILAGAADKKITPILEQAFTQGISLIKMKS